VLDFGLAKFVKEKTGCRQRSSRYFEYARHGDRDSAIYVA
jgi:hypothetical protein